MLTSERGGSANVGVSVTLVGKRDLRHHVQQLTWSYSGTPTGGRVTLSGLEGDTLDYDVTAGGPGGLALPPSCYGRVFTNVVATLYPGGSGVTGKINLFSELE